MDRSGHGNGPDFVPVETDPIFALEPPALSVREKRAAQLHAITCSICGELAIIRRADQTAHVKCVVDKDRHKTTKDRHHPDNPNRQPAKTNYSPFIGIDTEGGYKDAEGRQHLLYMSAKDEHGRCPSKYRRVQSAPQVAPQQEGEATQEDEGEREISELMFSDDAVATEPDGEEIIPLYRDNQPLQINEIFDWILSLPRDAYLVVFSGGYDFSQILRQLKPERLCRLKQLEWSKDHARLMKRGKADDGNPLAIEAAADERRKSTEWTDVTIAGQKYRLQYTPRKRFVIARGMADPERPWAIATDPNSTRTIHEVFGFFQSSFLKAVEGWLGQQLEPDILAKIEKYKEQRGSFDHMTAGIMDYCDTECMLLAKMMMKFRKVCLKCEAIVNAKFAALWERELALWSRKSPEGAGSLASEMHRSMGTPPLPFQSPI
jgi:hypothetical protein